MSIKKSKTKKCQPNFDMTINFGIENIKVFQ